MTRLIDNVQIAEAVNIPWAIGIVSIIFLCAHVLRSVLRKAKRLIHPPGRWRLPRRGGSLAEVAAPQSFHWRGSQHRDHVHLSCPPTRQVFLPPDYPTWNWPER